MKTWWRSSYSPLLPEDGGSCGFKAAGLVDAHVHVFPPDVIRRREACLGCDTRFDALYSSPQAKMVTASELLAQMDETGTQLSIIFGFAFKDLGLCREVNDYVLDAVRDNPDRLAGLACVSPGSSGSLGELERCLDRGMRGCGELAPVSASHQELMDLTAVADCLRERGLPLLVHASEPVGHEYPGKGHFTPQACVALAHAFPKLKLVLSHLGGGAFVYESMPEVRATLADVFYDTAAIAYLYSPSVLRLAVLAVGSEKLIFGSDYPLLQPSRCAEGLELLPLQHQNAIRAGNARRVYKL
jgi:predicted TIM-barrel fold metal-dependent hydrolase